MDERSIVYELSECDDGVWRTEAERRARLSHQDWWIEPVYKALNVCSAIAWCLIADDVDCEFIVEEVEEDGVSGP